jgi:hypothetical protein
MYVHLAYVPVKLKEFNVKGIVFGQFFFSCFFPAAARFLRLFTAKQVVSQQQTATSQHNSPEGFRKQHTGEDSKPEKKAGKSPDFSHPYQISRGSPLLLCQQKRKHIL